ncbi:hypothetical protein EJ997_10170 [Flaviflexus ciconiae]|uniref:Uncharacterized protein n=1 Tax=Flaviflexus ciconiae TaxID=2496867 RepID=A0A3Q9G2S7_9ACTO|nr:hypothetical protein [Flaviflexus ciconiae]AZQ77648.1 hypothetical protein EJ997_10170 [Flaviflexus ciconiae]
MAKMRGIKPEAFTDDKVLELSPLARWLFVGMWTQACDNGHLDDKPVQLKVRLLPVDNCDVEALIQELLDTGQVTRHDGWLKVENLSEHQRIDRRYLSLCKWCEHDEDALYYPDDKSTRRAPKATPSIQPSAQRAPDETTEGAPRDPDENPPEPHGEPNGHPTGTRRGHDGDTTGTQRVHDVEGEGEGEKKVKVNNPPTPKGEPVPFPGRAPPRGLAAKRHAPEDRVRGRGRPRGGGREDA